MDSTTLLDSALFQLTPTRTRFDLVLFCGSKKEKVASGLFEPFISHLKFARDQISRGGYSISLRPPSLLSPWFTKSTFERFVRFVNTPAILERFVSLEKEILQIEHSIQANESASASGPGQQDDGTLFCLDKRISNSGVNGNVRKSNGSSKLRKESETNNKDAEEENSKSQLQRLLETRKTLLRREQAMAYARGVVAGFEMDSMDDLISFADAFGAARLREACINYKELWNKKHGDGLWMAELAAVEACAPSEMSPLGSSGIVLTNEVGGLASNGTDSTPGNASSDNKEDKSPNSDQVAPTAPKFQGPMPWPNQIPQFFYPFQQPSLYQGYPFPPMQPLPHQFPGNMPWPPKGKSSKKKGNEDSNGDGSSESSESDSESDDSSSTLEDQEKRHTKTVKDYRRSKKNQKKPSKTVIIRNINYITPEGRNEDVADDELVDKISIKETVDAAVGFLGPEKRPSAKQGSGDDEDTPDERRSRENWDAFQNLLMRNDEKSIDEAANLRSLGVGEEYFALRNSVPSAKSSGAQMKENIAADSFIVTQRGKENGGGAKFELFESEESAHTAPRTRDSTDEGILLTKRSEILRNESDDIFYNAGVEKPVIKSGRVEDWFVADHAGKMESYERLSFDDDCILKSEGSCHAHVDESRKHEFIDDSFMVQSSLAGDDPCDPLRGSDISRVADLVMAPDMENGNAKTQPDKRETVDSFEPNDLCMILERNIETVEEDSWAVDHGVDLCLAEIDARLLSIRSSQDEDKGIPSGEKTKNVKKAGARPRIPGRSPNGNRTETMSRGAKKPSVASRTMAQKSRHEKEEETRKRVEELVIQRQKRIAERTAMAASRRASLGSTTTSRASLTSDKNKTSSANTNRFTSVKS